MVGRDLRWLALAILLGSPAAAQGQLTCTRPLIDCGQVKSGQRLNLRFDLTNAGSTTLEITDVRPACGCIVPRHPGLQRRLDPGQSTTLDVEVNTLGQAAGQRSWTASVPYRHAGGAGVLGLEVRAFLITEITVQPSSLTLFTDAAASHEVTLTDLRPKSLQVTAVHIGGGALQARLLSQERDASGHAVAKIRIEVSKELPPGRHEQTLSIYTDDPLYRHLQVPVRVIKQTRSLVSVGPRQVRLAAPAGRNFPARLVRVWAEDDQETEVTRVYGDDAALHCTFAAGPGNQTTVKIQADRARLTALPLHTAVHIEVRRPVAETVTIPVVIEEE